MFGVQTMTADTEEGISKLHNWFVVCCDKARKHERLPVHLSRGYLNIRLAFAVRRYYLQQ